MVFLILVSYTSLSIIFGILEGLLRGNFLLSLAQRTKKEEASRSAMFLQFTIAKQSCIRAENEEDFIDPFRNSQMLSKKLGLIEDLAL